MTRAAIALIVCLLAAPVAACEQPSGLAALRTELLAATNALRAEAGVLALTRDERLDSAAQAQACRTAGRERLSHRGSWFAGLGRRLRRAGYPYAMAAENLAVGQRGVAEVSAAWMASVEHRRNSLDARARQAGFGVAAAEDGRLHWSMIVAAVAP